MNDLQYAKSMLAEGDYTCVLCKEDQLYTSKERGVAPMVEFLSSGLDLRGFSAADKVIGKAAAMLFVLAGVETVYAPVMSETALHTFTQFGVTAICDSTTKTIINRQGNGSCPMEQAVANIETPEEALEAIKEKLKSLRK